MNKCIFLGNLTKDFETSTSQSGVTIGKSGMALNRGKDSNGNDRGSDFINLVAFGKTAETLQRFGQKGRRFLIETHVQTGSYDAKDGHKVYTYDFVIDRFEFADSKTTEEKPIDSGFMDIPDGVDEELPF